VTFKDNQGAKTSEVLFVYDVFDNLIEKSVDSDGDDVYEQEEIRIHDGGYVGAVLDANSAVKNRYLHGPAVDQVLAAEDDADVSWYATDNLGTVRDVTDSDGTVTSHIDFNAFGKLTGATGAVPFFAYTGREHDADVGLQFNRARWY
jgi:hypothetical protein